MPVVSLYAVRLTIPFALHLHREPGFAALLRARIGPFASEEEARIWEQTFVAAAVINWNIEEETLYQVEERSAQGSAVQSLTGRMRASMIAAPPKKTSVQAEFVIDVDQGETETFSGARKQNGRIRRRSARHSCAGIRPRPQGTLARTVRQGA